MLFDVGRRVHSDFCAATQLATGTLGNIAVGHRPPRRLRSSVAYCIFSFLWGSETSVLFLFQNLLLLPFVQHDFSAGSGTTGVTAAVMHEFHSQHKKSCSDIKQFMKYLWSTLLFSASLGYRCCSESRLCDASGFLCSNAQCHVCAPQNLRIQARTRIVPATCFPRFPVLLLRAASSVRALETS